MQPTSELFDLKKGDKTEGEERGRQFMNKLPEDEIKRKHYETHEEMRKEERNKRFDSKRDYDAAAVPPPKGEESGAQIEPKFTIEDLPQLVGMLNSSDILQVQQGAIGIRKLVAKRDQSPIQEIIDSGAVPRLIHLLGLYSAPSLQYEAAWCLTNIATGNAEQTQCLTEKGAIQKFIALMGSEHDHLKDQAVWALGNIAGESTEFRDMVMSCEVMPPLLKLLGSTRNTGILKNGLWLLSNLVRGKPEPDFHRLKDAIPVIGKIMTENEDKDVLTDCCWTLSYISEGGGHKIQYIIDSGVAPRLVQFLEHPCLGISVPSLRTLGSITTGDNKQTEVVVQAGLLPQLEKLLGCTKATVRKETAWVISNVTAGTASQLQQVFDSGVMKRLSEIAMHDIFEVRRECVWAISNATLGANIEQVRRLIELNAAEALCSMLGVQEARTLAIVLEGLENLLKKCRVPESPRNTVAEIVEQCGGLTLIEKLQSHPNSHVYMKTVKLIEEYFGAEDEVLTGEDLSSISIFNF